MGLGQPQSRPDWLQPAPGPGPGLPSPPLFPLLPPWVWQQAPPPPCHARRAPAQRATSRQRLGPGQTLPVPRHLSKPPNSGLRGQRVPNAPPPPAADVAQLAKGAGLVPPRATCAQMRSVPHPAEENSLSPGLRQIHTTVHTQRQHGGDPRDVPQVIPAAIGPHSPALKSLPTLYVPSSCSLHPVSGTARPWGYPVLPARNLTFPSFVSHSPPPTPLVFYSRIPLTCCVFILSLVRKK